MGDDLIDDGTGGLTGRIIGAAITVHRHFGPGLMEKPYERSLAVELRHLGMDVERQVRLPLTYRGVRLGKGYRMDLWVERCVVVEVKVATKLIPLHIAQVKTYVRLSESLAGLLFNFNVEVLSNGGFRRILPPRSHQ